MKFIAVLRALNLLEQLNNFMPMPPPRSTALLTSKNQVRQRVAKTNDSKKTTTFTWKNATVNNNHK